MNIITQTARSINYGLIDNTIDVTSICYEKLRYGNNIVIPALDNVRAIYFSDPIPNVLKSIFIIDENGEKTEYDSTYTIFIDVSTNLVTTSQDAKLNIDYTLLTIHQQLNINYGSMMEEFNQQRMTVRYLTGNEKVLELGGNIGRNSLVIGSILKQQNNSDFVVLECEPATAARLIENRDMNNMQFHVENSALSKRNLIQKGWTTIESDVVLDGYQSVQTITHQELIAKYNIVFDTLVLDCEGAFYLILLDMPEVLDNIKLIIVKNDYLDDIKKEYVDSVLIRNGFYVDYAEVGGWGPETPFYMNFYEVWKRYTTVDPVIQPLIEPVTESVVESVIEPVIESVVEPPLTESVAEPVSESISEPVVETVVEPPLTEPVVESDPISTVPVAEQEPSVIPLQVETTENESITYSIEPDNLTTESNSDNTTLTGADAPV